MTEFSEDPVTIRSMATKTLTASTATAVGTTSAMASSKSAARLERLGLTVLAATIIAVAAAFDIGHEDVFARTKLRVALAGAALLVLLVLWAGARARGRWQLPDILVGGYVGWSLLAFVAASDLGTQWVGEQYQFQGMASVVIYGVMYAAARRFVTSVERLVVFTWWLLAAGTHAAVYGVIQRLDLDPIWDTLLDGRVFSTIGNPNTLASVLVVALPLGILHIIRGSTPERAVAAVAVVIVSLALIFSASRGGFLAALVALAVLATVAPRPSVRGLETAAAGALVAIALVVAVVPVRDEVSATWDRVVSSLDSADESRRFHVDGWRATLAMIADHPLVGVGHDRFPEEFPFYRDEVLNTEGVQRFSVYRLESPHNVPLAIAAAAGVPAALLYLGVVAAAVLLFMRSVDDRVLRAALASFVAAHFVADLFVTADLTSAMVFWAVLGAMVGAVDAERNSRPVTLDRDLQPIG